VKEGPYVSWAAGFGHHCPYPDFPNADKRYVTQATDSVRAVLRPYKKPLQYGGVIGVTAVALLLIIRRRKAQ
jgi:hypothetical protein